MAIWQFLKENYLKWSRLWNPNFFWKSVPTGCNGISNVLRLPVKYSSSCFLVCTRIEDVSILNSAFIYLKSRSLLFSTHGISFQSHRHNSSPTDAKMISPDWDPDLLYSRALYRFGSVRAHIASGGKYQSPNGFLRKLKSCCWPGTCACCTKEIGAGYEIGCLITSPTLSLYCHLGTINKLELLAHRLGTWYGTIVCTFTRMSNLVDNIWNKDHTPTTTIERNIHSRTAWAWFYIIVQILRTLFVEVNHHRVLLCWVQNVPWLRDYYKLW